MIDNVINAWLSIYSSRTFLATQLSCLLSVKIFTGGILSIFNRSQSVSVSQSLSLSVFLSVSLYIDTSIGVSINVDVAVDVAIDICWSAVYSYTYISTCMQYKYIAIYVCMCALGCSVVSDSATTGYSPGKNAGVDCCGLLQDVCVYIDMYLCF